MGDCAIDRTEDERPRRGTPAWWFASRATGRITIVQAPNLLLVVFAASVLAGHLLDSHPMASRILGDIASGAIVLWALDEVARGVNPWRRALGTVVLVVSILSLVRG